MNTPKPLLSSCSLPVVLLTGLFALSGCRIQKPATVVPEPPSIDSFSSSAASVDKGGAVTLSWKTSNATSIELREVSAGELDVPVDTLEGTFQPTIEAASVFVLVARGPGGSDARAVSVALTGQELAEVSFQALPPIIPGGASTTLVWTAPGATTVTLTAGGQPIDLGGQRSSGAVTVSPRFDTTYTLTADGVTKAASVVVQAALLTASVTPRAAEVGDTVTLSWTAAGAERVVVSVAGRGQLFEATSAALIESGTFADVVPPTPDDGVIVYEVAAVKGTARFTRMVEVHVGTGLAITRLEASPVAAAGAGYPVRWETRAADVVELKVDGVTVHQTTSAQTAAVGTFSFPAPAADFPVELIATNTRGGQVTRVVQVDLVGVPTVATLTANPAAVAFGQPVTLTFAAVEARRARIVNTAGEVVFTVNGAGAEGGTATVHPGADTTYTLFADNLLGNPAVTATAAVTVTGAPATVTQFPPTAISLQNVTLSTPATGAILTGFPHEQVSAPAPGFVDISGTGRRVLQSGANVTSVDLPFTTFLWGRRHTGPLTISRAGWMAWGAPLVVASANTATLPAASAPAGLIAPFWDDLTLVADSGVYVELVGDAPDQSLLVQWDRLQVGTDASTQVTFQARVHQRGTVTFEYRTMTLAPAYASFVVGLQDQTRLLGVRATPTPTGGSALAFFGPLAAPLDVRVAKGSGWGGYLEVGGVKSLVSQGAGAYLIPSDIGLTELMFRPHAAVPNGQYIEFVNRTATALDLSGWELRAPNAPTYLLPAGYLLLPSVPTLVGASVDPAENDDAGVSLSWTASGFFLSEDAGSFTVGTADAGASFTYTGPADAGRGQAINVDPGPIVGTSGSPGLRACVATTPFGAQTPQQLGSPGSDPGCGFGYVLTTIPSRFVDVSDGGTALVNSPTSAVDGVTVPITLAATGGDPAPVAFGVRRDVVSMSLDGWLAWGSSSSTDFSNPGNPSTSVSPVGKLAIFWDDLHSTPGITPQSEMYWKRFAANEDPLTPAQHWVFQWSHVRHYATDPADDLNFEIKLFENGVIEYHYAELQSGTSGNYGNGNSATVWLENPVGDQALVIGINQPRLSPNTAWRFVPR